MNELYSLVEAYASLGDHRTGTSVDAATVDWFADELASRGADVERHPYSFDRYDATCEVTLDGDRVDTLPLFYEGIGDVTTADPVTAHVDAFSLMLGLADLAPLIEAARAPGRGAVVVATTGPTGLLVVPNRAPKAPGDVPVVLVAGDAAGRLEGKTEVGIRSRVVPGTSANVVASFGDGPDPLVIATPLSGWFRCAGERGTGIAIALELASELKRTYPLVVVGTTGHELVDLGLKTLIRKVDLPTPRAILHLGASVAATHDGRLSPTRVCNAAVPETQRAAITEALERIELSPNLIDLEAAAIPDRWLGEAREWCTLGAQPMVSITGHFRYFHTAQDVAASATDPEALALAFSAVSQIARICGNR